VDNLLVLARLEDDPQENRHAPLRTVIAEVLGQLRSLARGAHVELRVNGDLPEVEVNDAARLLLANYLTNAIKYRDPAARDHYAHIEASIGTRHSGEPEVVVRVLDNGLGVAADKRESLFERFFRAHPQTSEHGTGLGLSIVRETANALGGRAWADFPEKGSAFSFALPCRKAAQAARRVRNRRRERPRVA
jgi:signal transduction histidine kinase